MNMLKRGEWTLSGTLVIERSLEQIWFVIEDVASWESWWGDRFRTITQLGDYAYFWPAKSDVKTEVGFGELGTVRVDEDGTLVAYWNFEPHVRGTEVRPLRSQCEKYDGLLLRLKDRVERLYPVAGPAVGAKLITDKPRPSVSLPHDSALDMRHQKILEAIERHSVRNHVGERPSRNEVENLMKTVSTERGWLESFEDGETYNSNGSERLNAAERLADTMATEALPVLEEFFVEAVRYRGRLEISTGLPRLANALLVLGGAEAFSTMMKRQVIPALEALAGHNRTLYSEDHVQETHAKVLAMLRTEFGTIGDCESAIAKSLAEMETVRRSKESAELAGRERDFAVRFKKKESVWSAERQERLRKDRAKLADNQRQLAISKKRILESRCVTCGRPLGLFSRLRKRNEHAKCRRAKFQEGPDYGS